MQAGCHIFRVTALWLGFLAGTLGMSVHAQHRNTLKVNLVPETHTLEIQQEFTYVNAASDSLPDLYFNDWNHAYSDKRTALAKRFAEEFKKSLHLAKDSERGFTQILSVVDEVYRGVAWERLEGQDLVRFKLGQPLAPGDSTRLFITYTITLPPNRYTPYGYDTNGNYYLKDWYLTPAVYSDEWLLYSNKSLEDLYTDITDTRIDFSFPDSLYLGTNYVDISLSRRPGRQLATLRGVQRKSCDVILNTQRPFQKHLTPFLLISTDIQSPRYNEILQGVSIDRITRFIHQNLGDFPYEQLLVSEIDFNKNPLYGLNQLPSFIRPYEEQFQFEMKFLKTALSSYMRETIFLDPRKDKWISDAIINYLMIRYVETFYPDQKLLGKLSEWWMVRGFHLSQMKFNEQYPFLYMVSARRNLDQSLDTPNDSLIKFNQKIANNYKAGLGLAYLADYAGADGVNRAIKIFYETYKLKPVAPEDFKRLVQTHTGKDVNWFFDTYVTTSKQIDYKIKSVEKTGDSLRVTLKNKTGAQVPISLYGVARDSVISQYWIKGFDQTQTFTIPQQGERRLVLNYDQTIPEFNQRDNWKTLGGFFSSNKRLRFQFFRDSENPYYNQVFWVPVANYNFYDGITPGIRLTNKTLLQRPFVFDFAPTYALKEGALVGYGRFTYQQFHRKTGFYLTRYSLSGSSYHFQVNSRYSTLTPSVLFGWRPDDLISNTRSSLLLRYVNVFRTIDPAIGDLETEPDYSVMNLRYSFLHNNIIDYFSWFADAQHSSDFTKVALNAEYRRLFDNNRQLNLRLFAGTFLRNRTASDYFSFALDRPTDYLFDYDFLGRSEDTGLLSQQIIIAEGGFKSKLPQPFANDWMVTGNASFNLWRWLEVYGDVGLMKRRGSDAQFVYDSGIRLNLVTDYFELYFPVYSNLGWEVSAPSYSDRIRFIITISPKTLTGLFTRKWF